MTEMQKDSRRLIDAARHMMDAADWLALGGDYCGDISQVKAEIEQAVHDMTDILATISCMLRNAS